MSLVTRYRLFWAALVAALLGLAFWKNSQCYPHKSRLWRFGKAVIDTGLVVLMVMYAPALLLAYVVIWLTSPFRDKIIQVTTAVAAILAVTHLAGVVFEAVAVLGVFAVDRAAKSWPGWTSVRETSWRKLRKEPMGAAPYSDKICAESYSSFGEKGRVAAHPSAAFL